MLVSSIAGPGRKIAVSLRSAWAIQKVPGHLGLRPETVSNKQTNKQQQKPMATKPFLRISLVKEIDIIRKMSSVDRKKLVEREMWEDGEWLLSKQERRVHIGDPANGGREGRGRKGSLF